jgi:acyl-CoA reductase-like NAD-dependent aldehyde dehydrogenase
VLLISYLRFLIIIIFFLKYGGVKDSGLGREGLRYSIEEFTEPRIMLLKDIDKL